ncbi:MAG TPA: GNAT family N-acetyltransferase [Ktedonobacteraceae bacterium]|nr:GNAT family N-acetyltransferase [Ktedonobacteraceae bacterium]
MQITSRLFHGEQDLDALKQFVIAIRTLDPLHCYWHVGDLIWGMYQNTIFDPYQNIRLWQDEMGMLLGFAWFDESRTAFSTTLLILPQQSQHKELLDQMLNWVLLRASENKPNPDDVWQVTRDTIYTGVLEDDKPLHEAFVRHGFVRGEPSMVYMRQPLVHALADTVLPAGWQVRHVADESEFEERVSIHREVYHPSRVTLEAYRRMRTIPGYTPELDIAAVTPEGTFASYCICWLDPVNRCGEFEPVGTRAAFRRQKIGQAVMREGLKRLQARGTETAIVATNYDNYAARKLYESVGFHIVATDYSYSLRLM